MGRVFLFYFIFFTFSSPALPLNDEKRGRSRVLSIYSFFFPAILLARARLYARLLFVASFVYNLSINYVLHLLSPHRRPLARSPRHRCWPPLAPPRRLPRRAARHSSFPFRSSLASPFSLRLSIHPLLVCHPARETQEVKRTLAPSPRVECRSSVTLENVFVRENCVCRVLICLLLLLLLFF